MRALRRCFVCLMLVLPMPGCRDRGPAAGGGGKTDPRILWATSVGTPAFPTSTPAVGSDGTVYAQGRMQATVTWDGRPARPGILQAVLHAIDATGAVVRSLPGTSIRTPTSFDFWTRVAPWGTAYAVDSEGGLYGMFTDGTQLYRSVGHGLIGPPAIAENGRLFVGSSRGVWGFDLQAAGDAAAFSFADTSYAPAPVLGPDGSMYAPTIHRMYGLGPGGDVKWETRAGLTTPVLDPQGRLYYTNKNRLVALDTGGAQLWEFHADDDLSVPALAPDGSVVVIGAQGLVHVVAPDGGRRWAFAMETAVWSLPVVGADGTIYTSDRMGRITAITPAGKRRWSLKMSTTCGTPAAGDAGRVYVECRDGKVYAIAPP